MSEFTLVDPKGWEYDLHSVYSAYVGHFQTHNIAWYEKSWGHLFNSFEEFLAFSWPVIVVTDAWTGKAHIVTRLNSIGAFIKMIKTRFGETLPQASNIIQVTPFETAQRHLRHVSDYSTYRKLHSTLPAAVLSATKQRIRNGDPQAIKELWEKREKTFLAIDFEWSERNQKSCLEWGYAAIRCGHLNDLGHWPPSPDKNYRKGHYVVQEYVDKVVNKWCPNFPWHYAFGDSQVIPKARLPQIIQAVISSLASPDSETQSNSLVLVAHGINGDLTRLEEMKIALPHNMYIIDTSLFEKQLFSQGLRPPMVHPKSQQPRQAGSTLSLENLLRSISVTFPLPDPASGQPPLPVLPHVQMHNAGNDALMCLFALQYLLEPEGSTEVPTPKRPLSMGKALPALSMGGIPMTMPMKANSLPLPQGFAMVPTLFTGYATLGPGNLHTPTTPQSQAQRLSVYDLSGEFGQMRMEGAGGGGSPDGRSGSRSKSPGTTRLTPGSAGAGVSARNSRRLSAYDWEDANGR